MKKTRWILIVIGVVLALTILLSFAAKEPLVGSWYAGELEQSVIEISAVHGGVMVGTIVRSADPDLVGVQALRNIRRDSNGTYTATIYSARRDMMLDGTLRLDGPDQLKVTGRKLFLTKTFEWKRVKA